MSTSAQRLPAVSGVLPIARMRSLFRIDEVEKRLAKLPPREHESLRSTYERMLERGPERFQVKPSGVPDMQALYDALPNFTEVLDDVRRHVALCADSGTALIWVSHDLAVVRHGLGCPTLIAQTQARWPLTTAALACLETDSGWNALERGRLATRPRRTGFGKPGSSTGGLMREASDMQRVAKEAGAGAPKEQSSPPSGTRPPTDDGDKGRS